MPMNPMQMREFEPALATFPSVSARTICGPAKAAPAAVREVPRKRRREGFAGDWAMGERMPGGGLRSRGIRTGYADRSMTK
jgi:hypothetical protein